MDTSQLIQQAREAIQAGNKPQARQLLQQAVAQDPQSLAGWLWLARVAPSAKASLAYIGRAEKLQPNHPQVAEAKAWVERHVAKKKVAVAAPPVATRTRRPAWGLVGGLALLLVAVLAGVFFWQGLGNGETAVSPPSPTPIIVAQAAVNSNNNDEAAPTDIAPSPEPTSEAIAVANQVEATPEPTAQPERILAKNASSSGEPRAQWTATPLPTNTPVPTPTLAPTFVAETTSWIGKRPYGVGANERWIDVNLSTQTLSAFEGDTLVFSSVISSGTASHPTVTGQFRTWHKTASQTMDGSRLGYDYYLENVPYVMYFYEDYAIHGAYWHNNFGTPMSHGCVNMNIADSEWLFNWAGLGTLVNVHY